LQQLKLAATSNARARCGIAPPDAALLEILHFTAGRYWQLLWGRSRGPAAVDPTT
jgi:hypothetical protein